MLSTGLCEAVLSSWAPALSPASNLHAGVPPVFEKQTLLRRLNYPGGSAQRVGMKRDEPSAAFCGGHGDSGKQKDPSPGPRKGTRKEGEG